MCRRAEPDPRRFADASGFTLVEVLVALTVMALVLGVLYRGVVQTRAAALAFGTRTQVEVVARSLLAEFRADRTLRDGSHAGTRDGRRWTLQASPMDLAGQLPEGDETADADGAPSGPGRAGGAGPTPNEPAKPTPAKPRWVAQRLVLRVAGGARPLETEAVHLVRLAPPDEAPE